jgi:hypothetical protein
MYCAYECRKIVDDGTVTCFDTSALFGVINRVLLYNRCALSMITPNKAEVSKVASYSLKANSSNHGSNVRGVGVFCDTFSNLGQLFLYNLKNLAVRFPEI